jgi:hypothetical protein
LGADGVDGSFAADAAGTGGVEVAFEAVEVEGGVAGGGGELDADDVVEAEGGGFGSAVKAAFDLVAGVEDAFGEKEAGGELEIFGGGGIACGGAHRDGDGFDVTVVARAIADADFEGFFDGELIVDRGAAAGDVASYGPGDAGWIDHGVLLASLP